MSVVANDTAARPKRADATARIGRQLARTLRQLDRSERFSQVWCISTLLIVGLIVKTGPAIQAFLAHN